MAAHEVLEGESGRIEQRDLVLARAPRLPPGQDLAERRVDVLDPDDTLGHGVLGLADGGGLDVRLIYGPRWAPVVPLLALLSFPALVLPLLQPMGWLLIATGKVRQMFLISASTLPLFGICYYVAVGWGARGVALAAAVLYTVPVPLISVYFAHAAAGLSLRRTLRAVLPVILACVGAAVAALAVGSWVAWWGVSWVLVLGVKLMVGALIYFSLAIYLVRPLPIHQLEQLAVRVRRIFCSCVVRKTSAGET